MTSNDLSRELCEICKIPYTKTEDNCRVYDNDGELCEEYVYKLDFTKPENFVKLREIVTDLTTENFLKNLIMRLEFVTDSYSDEMKQAIREAEWVYE